ncbi:hypothetical protein [Nocardia nepalensis]|uniref:hypothetical protein n=1 Tax=Nocardia nepalensis TaxID=3375448 RepID=UPI003B66C017
MTRNDEVCAVNSMPLHTSLSAVQQGLESVATEVMSEIATEHTGCEFKGVQGEVDVNVEKLTRLASALGAMPDVSEESEELPRGWVRYDDGTWTPIYPDGSTGHQFTWTQMIAARGEDIGNVIESLLDAGVIGAVQEVGIDVFDHGRG